MRWVSVEIDLEAVRHNVRVLRSVAEPAAVWAVVKANGYGHGAVEVARAALDAGAQGLCVALVQEGVELRAAGVTAPILVLSEPPIEAIPDLVDALLVPAVYHEPFLDALAEVVEARGRTGHEVHIKVDTGMRRVGAEPSEIESLLRCADRLGLTVGGLFTHLACADEPESVANAEQLRRFDDVLSSAMVRRAAASVAVHAANSAAAIAIPAARRNLVRCGIAIYGISPGSGLDDAAPAVTAQLRPAMRLVARVSHVKRVEAGVPVSYGWRYRTDADTVLATVPIGYADGVPRRLGAVDGRRGADVLVGGRRCPIVGVVTMDQLVVDVSGVGVSTGSSVAVGDEVVLIGSQGEETIKVEEWADLVGTIGYEIVCGVSARVPRRLTAARERP